MYNVRIEDLPPPKKNESVKEYAIRLGVNPKRFSNAEKTKQMIKHQKDIGKNIKDLIFDTLYENNRFLSSEEILDKINNRIRQNKPKREFKKNYGVDLDNIKDIKIDEEIKIRVVQKWIKELTNEGLVVGSRKTGYSISNILNPKIKIHSEDFGSAILASTMKYIHPHHDTLEENIQRLVESFGLYVLYCFMEGARPYIYKNDERQQPIVEPNDDKKDQLTLSWIENVIDPKEMFDYFMTLLRYQLSNEEIKSRTKTADKILKKSSELYKNDYSMHNLFALKHKHTFASLGYKIKENDDKLPRYEIDDDKITILIRILERKHSILLNYIKYGYDVFNIPSKNSKE